MAQQLGIPGIYISLDNMGQISKINEYVLIINIYFIIIDLNLKYIKTKDLTSNKYTTNRKLQM